ncbi:MAG: hypothetical protein JSR33_13630 [Proteobacteria bacterium]|nr:hypothetical protein [Pseudomonadota bacterium]
MSKDELMIEAKAGSDNVAVDHFFQTIWLGGDSDQAFSQLTTEERRICGQLYNSRYLGPIYALHAVLQQGRSLSLIKKLILVTDPEVVQDANTIFRKIFDKKEKNQLEIVTYFIKYFRDQNVQYNPADLFAHAINYGREDAATFFLQKHAAYLNPENSQALLQVCERGFFKLKLLTLLMKKGAKIQGVSDNFGNLFQLKVDIDALLEYVEILKERKIDIPVSFDFFSNNKVKLKEKFIKEAYKAATPAQLLKIEQQIALCGKYLNVVSLDNINTVFEINPSYRIFNPDQLGQIAVVAILAGHKLMLTLIERGLNLNQVFYFHLTYSNYFRSCLDHVVAFFPRHLKLLSFLTNAKSINHLGRTAAHYAALAMPLPLEQSKTTDKPKRKTKAKTQSQKQLALPAIEDKLEQRIAIKFQEKTRYALCPHFELIGSVEALEYAITPEIADLKDDFDCTPLDYAAMQPDFEKRKGLLAVFYNLLLKALAPVLVSFPYVIVQMVAGYLSLYDETPNQVLLGWVQRFYLKLDLKNADRFTNDVFVAPLLSCVDEEGRFIENEANIAIARFMLEIFNRESLFGLNIQQEIFRDDSKDLIDLNLFWPLLHPNSSFTFPVIPSKLSRASTGFGFSSSSHSSRRSNLSVPLAELDRQSQNSQTLLPAQRKRKRPSENQIHSKQLRPNPGT